jgi:uncharacterized membrane protein HdeD (DUF308 family)
MIGRIFLGRLWHWAVLVATGVLFWLCGRERLHVIEFNIFVSAMLVGTAVIVGAILLLHAPGEKVTRDEIKPTSDDDTGLGDAAA